MSQYDCIFIPGGGLLLDGSLPSWTIARLDRALSLISQTRFIAFLSGGTVHKPPPLDQDGFPIFESRQAALYLVRQDLDPAQLLTEISSYDTIGNAYFSRLLFELDNISDLSDRLNLLINNKNLRDKLATNGHKFAHENYASFALSKKYAELVKRAVEE